MDPKVPSLALGLSLLVSSKNGMWSDIDAVSRHRQKLSFHPFGLDLPVADKSWNVSREVIVLRTGGTRDSVDAMIAHIIWVIGGGGTTGPTRLREILVQCSKDRPGDHMVYFEVWTNLGVFICADCTDCSGEGGGGTKYMRSIFELLSVTYGLAKEQVEIPYFQAIQISKTFRNTREVDIGLSL